MAPEDNLRNAHRRAYLLILSAIARADATTVPTIRESLRGLLGMVRQWVRGNVPGEYRKGRERALGRPLSASEDISGATPVENVHRLSIEVLAQNVYEDLGENIAMIGRRTEDLLRDIQVQESLRGRLAGEPVRDTQKRIVEELNRRGITGYVDSAGREWKPDTYAGMAGRTVLAEAQNLGLLNQLEEAGHDLVQITDHDTSCPVCSIYEGRVYSISGLSSDWPALRGTAFSVAYHTIHPNCRHRLAPYSERYADDPARDKRLSNRPFEDTRPKKEKEAYDEAERRKREARERRRKQEESGAIN